MLPIGAATIVVLLLARIAWPAWRLGSTRSVRHPGAEAAAAGRRAWLAGRLATLGLPLTVAAGVRLALEPGQGRTAVPVRSALIGTTLSVLAVTAAFTFGANLLHLVHTPRLYGQAWDTEIDLQFQVISRPRRSSDSAPIRVSPAGPTVITGSSASKVSSYLR